MQVLKRDVYLPAHGEQQYAVCSFDYGDWGHVQDVRSEEGYFFTPEQLNEYTTSVIKQALEIVTEKTYETYHTVCEDRSTKGVFETQKEALDLANKLNRETNLYHDWNRVIRLSGGIQSIAYIFEDIFNKFKV